MITVNGRSYKFQSAPVVGVCMDGTSMNYYEAAASVMPNLQRFIKTGSMGLVHSVIPSFTNPNNMAIVTGTTPDKNGICGNYWYDRKADKEVMMNEPSDLLVPTILSAFSKQNKKVAVVTAKDKLRKMLSKDLNGICFSAEYADKANIAENGIESVTTSLMEKEQPGIYDPDISVYVIEAGVRLLKKENFDLLYLTTTDYVQHKYPPGAEEANNFLSKIDYWLGELDKLGAIIGVTADHGMQGKTNADGTPKVLFIETILKEVGDISSRVILPITDPYVVHHGALGGYGTVYLEQKDIKKAKEIISSLEGVELVLTNAEAAARFNLPPDKIGELVLLSDARTTIGRAREWHDMDKIKEGLRSHGSLHTSIVPMIFNRKLNNEYQQKLDSGNARNFDLFDFLSNGI